MSEYSESLRRHLPFLNKLISQLKGNPFVKELEKMKNVIECDYGKKLSPKQVQGIETKIALLKAKACGSTSGSAKKNMNNKMEVICISSDDETSNTNLPYHKEHEVVEINSPERIDKNGTRNLNNQAQEIIIKPERPDVEIIMTTIQTNNIIPDTDSQKITIKPERCEVETIIKEVKLISDHNSNTQQENHNIADLSLTRVKEEESESDIDDYKTVYSGYSDQYDPPEPVTTQNNDEDDEIIKPTNTNRKRRKISSSSDESDKSKSKEKRKRRRILQSPESSDDENKSQKTTSSTSRKRRRNKSNSSSGSEFYSAESAKSSDTPVIYKSSIEDDTRSLENFRATVLTLSINSETTDTNEIVDMIKEPMQDETEIAKIYSFLQRCCDRGILELDVSGPSRNSEIILNEFVNLTLSSTRQLRNRAVTTNEKDQTSSDEEYSESSENSILDFSDDQDYQCYLYKNGNPSRKHKASKKLRRRKKTGELEKLREDIDRSFIKPGLLTLKPREHKKVNYKIDNVSSSSDDSDAFVNSVPKTKPDSAIKKKRGRKRLNDSNSSKADQSKNIKSDDSDSEICIKRLQGVKRLEDLDSDRTTPDNLVAKPFEALKNEDNEDNRSTPDIDLDNDPRVISFEKKNNSRTDEDIDTDCSSGESIHVSPKHILSLSDEDEDENNPKYHFITVQKITGCQVKMNKLNLIYKPEPYKVCFQNGIWKISNADLNKDSADDKKPPLVAENVQNTFKDHDEDPSSNVSNIKTQDEDKEDSQNKPITPDLPLENGYKAIEDHLFYDPIMSDSDEDFINMEPNENIKDPLKDTIEQDEIREDEKPIEIVRETATLFTETKDQNDKNLSNNVAVNPLDIMMGSITSINSITEEKYMIREPSLYDPISSDSEDDALHIDIEAETSKKEQEVSKNKENMNKANVQVSNQHPVAKNNTVYNKNIQNKTTESNLEELIPIEDSEEIVEKNKVQKELTPAKPRISVSPSKKPNSSLKEKLNKNSTLSPKQSSTQSNKTAEQKTSQKTTAQKTPQKTTVQNVSSNNSRRKCSPMSKLLTENEKKVLNLSYISCRGGYQYRCLNSCKYYNLREDAFKYHIQSRHVMDKWAGFCNLCGKSFSKEIRPLIDEYEHMMKYHIMPEHEQRISTKENMNLVNDNDDDSHDSDCIILSQPSENNSSIPQPIAVPKDEKVLAQMIDIPANEVENLNNAPDLTKSTPQSEMSANDQNRTTEAPVPANTRNVSNVQQVPTENQIPKQILRVKCLPGDKLSGRNEESLMPPLDPEMTFGELSELEMARKRRKAENQPAVQESSSNHYIPPMTPLPEGCIPETTAEQEATLQAVIEENISRYVKQPQQPVKIRACTSLAQNVQPQSVILHKTSNALVTYLPPNMPYNGAPNNPRAQTATIQRYQAPSTSYPYQQSLATRPPLKILPKPSYPVRPTATIAPSQQRGYNDVETGIPSTVIISTNNAQIANTYINTVTNTANTMPTVLPVLVPATNIIPNYVVPIQNQNPSTSHENVSRNIPSMLTEAYKLRSLRPWLNIDDIKAKDLISKCFEKQYLSQLYKCMLITCSFATDNSKEFLDHLNFHRQAVKNPRNPIFCCSYCTYNTMNPDDLVSHISTKYSRCRFYCDRCFYRTCSQYSAVEHTKIHKYVGSTKIHHIQTILPIKEDQEFDKIIMRELPTLKCFGCPQIFNMYEPFRIHVNLCCPNSSILCYKCNKVESITNLEDHQTNCYRVYTYNCCYCLFGTQLKNTMSDHVVHTHMDKIPFYYERNDISHLSTPLQIKAACVKKFAASKLKVKFNKA